MLQDLFSDLEQQINLLKTATGLNCPSTCGNCCLKRDIYATSQEFQLLATHLFQTGTAESVYEQAMEAKDKPCILLRGIAGPSCRAYEQRGLICRLFGFSALNDKYGKPRLSTCKILKGNDAYAIVQAYLDKEENIPYYDRYYTRLAAIYGIFPLRFMPINLAIAEATALVLFRNDYEGEQAA